MNSKNKKFNIRKLCYLAVLLTIYICLVSVTYVYADQYKNVLLLHSYNQGLRWTDSLTKGIKSVLNFENNIALTIEYMDTKRINDRTHYANLLATYKHKFKAVHFDVIVTADDNALHFALKYEPELFPGVPIVFCGLSRYTDAIRQRYKEVTGVVEQQDMLKTMNLALHLHPDAESIFIINDMTTTGKKRHKQFVTAIKKLNRKVPVEFLEDFSMEELLERLRRLPKNSVVVLHNFNRDKRGVFFSHREADKLISNACKQPIYSCQEHNLGLGIVGGFLTVGKVHGELAGHMVLQILNGKKASTIPIVMKSPNPPMFDYTQLKIHGISLKQLPKGSIVINKPIPKYKKYKKAIWITFTVIICLLVWVLFLLISIIRRKKAEEALRESEEKYRSIMESMKDGVYICSPEFRIEYMNAAMIDRIGREVTGEICHEVIYDLDEKCPWCMFNQSQQKGHVAYEVEDPKNNCYYSIINSPISHANGTVSELVISRDITEIKTLEEWLQQSQKMEAIGTLAGGIAHDFNNALYAIMGYADLTMDDVPEGSRAQNNLKGVLNAANRAKEMVQQILTFSRKADTVKEPIKIQSIVKETLKMLRTSIPTTIEFRQNIDEDCRPVMADPTQVHQVVMNLATNAYHSMREKGGVLSINVAKEKVGINDSASYPDLHPGKYVKLTVSDTGHGMDKAVIEKIFDPFFTTKPVGEGTGMGLSTVYGIVKSHGGDIKVYSEPGKGTVFHIYFPIIETKPVESKIASGPVQKGGEHILLVDDEKPIAFMLKQILERLGYQVTSCTSSVDALEAFRTKPDKFDLVITDMSMPNMSGIQLAPKLLEIRPDIPIILCTGFSEITDENRAKALGISEFVMKPVDRDRIAAIIRKELDK